MAPLIRRYHLLEINDQSWFPETLRGKVQACLTLLWTLRIPILQPVSPATLVAQTLLQRLGNRSTRFTYVDFCAGAGGPTLAIEKEFNAGLAAANNAEFHALRRNSESDSEVSSHSGADESIILTPATSPSGSTTNIEQQPRRRRKSVSWVQGSERPDQAYFVLTDIAPHLSAWTAAAEQSTRVRFIETSIDASAAPIDLLTMVEPALPLAVRDLPVFRLFSLAFHHFDDPLAERILANTIDTSVGFAILELQDRSIPSLIMTFLLFFLMLLLTPIYFWNDPIHLIFSIFLPIIPFVVAADGIVSGLRTRTGSEIDVMMRKVLREQGHDIESWKITWGSEWHTWPLGKMTWVIGMKKDKGK